MDKKSVGKYLIYGSSIVFTKGLEILLLFFSAHLLAKKDYGSLEFYKKVIEVGAQFIGFGFPALLLSYTRSEQSKKYFYTLSVLFILLFSIVMIPVFSLLNWLILLVPISFYAIFFTGGITQSYILILKGSNRTSLYKIFVSILFYPIGFILVYYYNTSGNTFVYPAYFLFPLLLIWFVYELKNNHIVYRKLIKYWQLLKKLLLSSLTLVVSNFANLMFLYTDIFIIKLLAESGKTEILIADYSFSLNVANILMLIPITLIQVDYEKIKKHAKYVRVLNKRIFYLLMISTFGLAIGFKILTGIGNYTIYANTYTLFLVILGTKIFQSLTVVFGVNLIIHKQFNKNLLVNLLMLSLNMILSYVLFFKFGLFGVAFASGLSLLIRLLVLIKLNREYIK